MQAVIDACKTGELALAPALVIGNNRGAQVFERAQAEGLAQVVINSHTHPDPAAADQAALDALLAHDIKLIVLAGYMKKIGAKTLAHFHNRILNIHPALLPRFGGKGMFGERVHEAVLDSGEIVTGATVHLVNEQYDEGQILAQREVAVLESDDVPTLAKRVLRVEHELLVETLREFVKNNPL